MTIQELKQHQHITNHIAREALKCIAEGTAQPYQAVAKLFIDGDIETTMVFWELVHEEHPDQFNRVYFCHTCKKFNLYLEDEKSLH